MESTGIIIAVVIVLALVIVFVVGRAIRKKKPAVESKPGNKRPAVAQFTHRGH